MRIDIHPEAHRDFDDAFDWYFERNPEAAVGFAAQIESTLSRIAKSPERFAKLDDQHRRCLVRRFPYHVVYRVVSESIYVIAIAHGARRPGYWKDRA